MKNILLPLFIVASLTGWAQKNNDSIQVESVAFQKEMNTHYADKEHSPLSPEDLANFHALPFFNIDSTYYVIARLERAKRVKTIKFKTSTDRKPKYDVYGTVYFSIKNNSYSLKIYQNNSFKKQEKYKNDLFLPFLDLTNGSTTYGGGRYIDLLIPDGDTIHINFNKAYNPYCAYSGRYSCPVVPEENFINLEINAGVMAPKDH